MATRAKTREDWITTRLARYSRAIAVAERGEGPPQLPQVVAMLREGFNGIEIAELMGVARATVYQWLDDPTGEKLRKRHERHGGICVDCGATTSWSSAYRGPAQRCLSCEHKRNNREKEWTREAIIAALQEYHHRFGRLTATDLNTAEHARHATKGAAERWAAGRWPVLNTVMTAFGSWNAALETAGLPINRVSNGKPFCLEPADYETTLRLVREGVPTREIARRFGVTPEAIHMRLERMKTTIGRERRMAAPLTATDVINREIERQELKAERLKAELEAIEETVGQLKVAKQTLNGKPSG